MVSARDIPAEIARKVRQECGFCCVICRAPIYDYDHIDQFSEVGEHTVENLALLCPMHHSGKSRQRIHPETVRRARSEAASNAENRTGQWALPAAGQLSLEVGTCTATAQLPVDNGNYSVIWVDGRSYFTLHSVRGLLTFSIIVCDKNGEVLVEVDHGAIVTTTDAWDITYEGKLLKIWNRPRDIVVEMILTNTAVNVQRGFFSNGVLGVEARKDGLVIIADGEQAWNLQGSAAHNGDGAFAVWVPGRRPPGRFGFTYEHVPWPTGP